MYKQPVSFFFVISLTNKPLKMRFLLFLMLLANFTGGSLDAQNNNPKNEDRILDGEIHSVQLHIPDAILIYPIAALKTAANTLLLEFDHMGTDLKDYSYTIVHCNSDWQPSELDDNQYIDGFTEDRITNVINSVNTLSQYTHYTLGLPNSNMRWSKSGNFLLKVFDNDNNKELVLVRRFMVVESTWRIDAQTIQPAKVSKLNSHHELSFSISTQSVKVFNPINDVKAFILQNGRWDNAMGPVPPYITRGDQIIYDYQDRIVFPAGKEFRSFDIRTYDFHGENVKIITQKPDYYEVTLRSEKSRAGKPYLFSNDINGRYVIDNTNANQTVQQCDYSKVLFSIEQGQEMDGKDVYVFGELSDWQLKPEFKMEYVEQAHMYVCEPFLKQGYYNYEYVVVDHRTGAVDEEGLEGNWYETGNQYTILAYFRPYGSRYERLMAVTTIDSSKKN